MSKKLELGWQGASEGPKFLQSMNLHGLRTIGGY